MAIAVPEHAVLAVLTGTPAQQAASRAAVPVASLIEATELYRAAGRAAVAWCRAIDEWLQFTIEFPDPGIAERTAARVLAPKLRQAARSGIAGSWWYIRKSPHWRLRVRIDHRTPATPRLGTNITPVLGRRELLRTFVADVLDELTSRRLVTTWSAGIYEPETHAFGGPAGMEVAHRLFHADSVKIVTYLDQTRCSSRATAGGRLGARELSLLLCTALMRAAGQDWYEQGDVWCRVTKMRSLDPDTPRGRLEGMAGKAGHVLALDTRRSALLAGSDDPFDPVRPWLAVMDEAGGALGDLARAGELHRGIRGVLAHHVIFHWNRLGLSTATQAVLAHAGAAAVFGTPPTIPSRPTVAPDGA